MLPVLVQANFERMVAEGLLSEREKAFFTDNRLVSFWRKVDGYLSGVNADWRDAAASMLVGSFIIPIAFGYGDTGTKERPTHKKRVRKAQSNADPVIKRIANLAGDLAAALDELEDITTTHPDAVRFIHVVQSLIHDDAIQNLSSYWSDVRTSEALRILQSKFDEYPDAIKIFQDVPGMASQKTTWRDWLHEAQSNLDLTMDTYPSALLVSETDWVNLANVLCAPGGAKITRNAVQDARRRYNPQPE